MALNVWLVGLVVFGLLFIIFGALRFAKNKLMDFIDSQVPVVKTFKWLSDVEAEITLTDGKVLRGAGGRWVMSDGKPVFDMGLRIALKRRYDIEVEKVLRTYRDDS